MFSNLIKHILVFSLFMSNSENLSSSSEETMPTLILNPRNIDRQRVRLRQAANDAMLGFREYHSSARTYKLIDDAVGMVVAMLAALTATLLGLDSGAIKQYSFPLALITAVVSAGHTSLDASGKWHTRQTIATKYRELNDELNILLSREPVGHDETDRSREWSILARDADSRMSLIRSLEHDGMMFDSIKKKDREAKEKAKVKLVVS
jgi:hypothetical protein